jgi:hypothetical protein
MNLIQYFQILVKRLVTQYPTTILQGQYFHCSIFKSKMQSLFESWPIGDLKIPRKIACVRFETPNQING